MDLSNFFQILDVWTPAPVESSVFLITGLLIYALPIIIIVLIIIIVKRQQKKKQANLMENQNQQSDSRNDSNN